MTLDELKAELEALTARIDDDLAAEIMAKAKDDIGWRAWTVQALFPRDKTARPENGCRFSLSLTAWFEPIRYNYVEKSEARENA